MRRILAVCTCHQRTYPKQDQAGHKNGDSRADIVRATWYKNWERFGDQIDLMFFYGRGDRQPAPNEIFLDVADDYYSLPAKVREICRWCTDNGYSEVTKVDDDVFVYVDRLLASTSNDDYRGFEIESDIKYASGTCYQLSRRAMKLVVDAEIPEGEWREDRHVGRVLLDSGIQLVNDERFLCCNCPICTTKYKDSISIHTTQSGQLYELMETSHV